VVVRQSKVKVMVLGVRLLLVVSASMTVGEMLERPNIGCSGSSSLDRRLKNSMYAKCGFSCHKARLAWCARP
jgi:hypothetical protein